MINVKLLTILIFILAYALMVIFYKRKTIIVWLSVLALLLLGILTISQALNSINLNVMLLYFGMLFVGEVFLVSKMPDYLATIFTSRANSTGMAMIIVCAFTGILSIFLENVAVVLLVAPIALSIARQCNISPIPLFTGLAISSNLQGAATLIGDPPSMLLAGFAKLNFNDFFFIDGKPSIFFAVQIGFIASLAVLYFFFRKNSQKMPSLQKSSYDSIIPTILAVLLILSLIINSSMQHSIEYMNGLLCVIFGLFAFIWYILSVKEKKVKEFIAKLDWETGIFLIGVFILVESLSASGVLNDIAKFIMEVGQGSPFIVFCIIVLLSVILSAFIDNVPFLLAMLPVTQLIVQSSGASPYLLYFGLLIGASVGGNITPIGASANIVAMGIMKKHGHNPKFMGFVKMGLPFTIASVIISSLFLWLVFG